MSIYLAGVPSALPAMIKSNRIQEKVANVGFDWSEPQQVWDKVKEEIFEVAQEIDNMDKARIEEEMGDLFFSLINASRLYGIDPENALEKTNKKFINRFNYLENKVREAGKNLKDMTLAEMDEYWNEAKLLERKYALM